MGDTVKKVLEIKTKNIEIRSVFTNRFQQMFFDASSGEAYSFAFYACSIIINKLFGEYRNKDMVAEHFLNDPVFYVDRGNDPLLSTLADAYLFS